MTSAGGDVFLPKDVNVKPRRPERGQNRMTEPPDSPDSPENGSAPPRRAWPRLAGWLAVAALTVFYVSRQVAPFLAEPRRLHCNDFKHIYLGAALIAEGQSPYDPEALFEARRAMELQDARFRGILPYVYLPFTGAALIPLTWLPDFNTAAWAWFWINQALFLGGAFLAARAVGLPWRSGVIALTLFLLAWNVPLERTLSAGQLNGVLLFFFALVLWMTGRAPAPATGAAAAFAALFKLSPAILFFWFLAERRRREAVWMAVWLVAGVAATLPLAGPRTHLEFLPLLRDMGYGRSTWAAAGQRFYRDPYNQSLNSFYHHAFADYIPPRPEIEDDGITPWWNLGPRAANAFTWIDTLALLGVTAFLLWPRARRAAGEGNPPPDGATPSGEQENPGDTSESRASPGARSAPPLESVLAFSTLVTLSLLVPSLLWDHYLSQLLLVHLALARALLQRRASWFSHALFALIVIVNGAPVVFDQPAFLQGIGLLGMSLKLWTTLATWFLLCWLLIEIRRAPRVEAQPMEA